MRSIWKGSISFGLVTIPIKVVSATENHSVSFRQVHIADEGRIRYRKVCELDGQELSGDEIGKAYQAADGTLVQISDEDLAALPLPTARTVEILGFVPISSVDPYQLDRSYYLAPDTGADKPYVLLREALRRSGQAAVAKLAMRGRETLALVRTREDEDVLGMHTLLWPDEIRSSEGLAPTGKVNVRDAELDMADTLMDTLGSVDMSELHDEYREAVETLVNAKLEGIEPPSPGEEAARGGRVVDLMAALEDSVRSARESRESRGEGGEDATVTDISGGGRGGRQAKKSTAKKSTAGKGAAKKSQAKKSTGRKATAKKSTAKKSAAKKTASKKSTTKKAAGSRRRAS
ncbi:Ku protein [Streptomyces sp. 3MP-14]|uniref:Non-homologous end joining protein Ku n=1 Tax=Streptomyces mimosae TaxID=2586635 RepID=A0A5N6A487_9ACTN|nr:MULTISPECIES: Ku protein [Streptomyces]KAB8162520.1 Ku protein [Streptomyces mimosae]KAB8174347.1 Ku protein [Streptomyces sp. 3MP-14]